ncbi:MAG: hypothetical protein IKO06_02545 [Alphaproteobacteria bacterium]|nr:hypothetical protein [Alphaproteobacteria bacterium]
MKFMFFTLGGRFYWEDVFNYQNWVIQKHCFRNVYRLLDPYDICRESGDFEQCKETLLQYMKAYEAEALYDDTVILLPGYGRTRNSMLELAEYLKKLPVNVVIFNYASLKKDITYHAHMLLQFVKNMQSQSGGNISIINYGAGCLVTRAMINASNNFHNYKIVRVLDVNPLNSGSDLAELLACNRFFQTLLGPMLNDIQTPNAVKIPKLPQDVDHGIIFCPTKGLNIIKSLLAKYESFPFSTPPSEDSYAKNVISVENPTWFPLQNPLLFEYCRNYIENGEFAKIIRQPAKKNKKTSKKFAK